MKKYFKYLSYVFRHKWFVMLECFKMGLYWRGIMHDMSKLLPDEIRAYAEYFYGERIDDLEMGSAKMNSDFRIAWLKHLHRNPHHWQYWNTPHDDGRITALEMPERFGIEMICDWRGVSLAVHGEDRSRSWYKKNYHDMTLHPVTRAWVDMIMDVMPEEATPEFTEAEYKRMYEGSFRFLPELPVTLPTRLNTIDIGKFHEPARITYDLSSPWADDVEFLPNDVEFFPNCDLNFASDGSEIVKNDQSMAERMSDMARRIDEQAMRETSSGYQAMLELNDLSRDTLLGKAEVILERLSNRDRLERKEIHDRCTEALDKIARKAFFGNEDK